MNAPRPYGLLVELTHECPLHCPYCSNPPKIKGGFEALGPEHWQSAIAQAAELGVLQCSFSGGEPLLNKHLSTLVETARKEGLYTNLITSGIGLTQDRAAQLKQAGLDNVQISFQTDSSELGDSIAGAKVHERKLVAARLVKEAGMNLSINVVLHRFSIDRIDELANLAGNLGASRIELAHTQFYGWAFDNRRLLLPTPEQMQAADEAVVGIKERYNGVVEVLYVKSDYYDKRPKPCMGGWGQKFLTIDPWGFVLPCPTARSIPNMEFANVRDLSLKSIWLESEAFQRFRGFDWMPELCKSCEFHTVDFGGCRCQAALLTGDAGSTDPVCDLSPHRQLLDRLFTNQDQGQISDLKFRTAPTSL